MYIISLYYNIWYIIFRCVCMQAHLKIFLTKTLVFRRTALSAQQTTVIRGNHIYWYLETRICSNIARWSNQPWSCMILIKICKSQCFLRKLSIPINSTKVTSCKTSLAAFAKDFKVNYSSKLISREFQNYLCRIVWPSDIRRIKKLWYSLFTPGLSDQANWSRNMFLCPRWCTGWLMPWPKLPKIPQKTLFRPFLLKPLLIWGWLVGSDQPKKKAFVHHLLFSSS